MLVLRRRTGDSLLIDGVGGGIEIKILDITPTRVKLGIVAPDGVTILRKEMLLTCQQNASAAKKADPQLVKGLTGRFAGR